MQDKNRPPILERLNYRIGQFERRFRVLKLMANREECEEWRNGWRWNWRSVQYQCEENGSAVMMGVMTARYFRAYYRHIAPKLKRVFG